MINNTSLGCWDRVNAKSLEQQFLHEMVSGLGCSRFEAQAILETVHAVFEPLMRHPESLQPGQVQLCVVDAQVGAGTPLREAAQRLVTVTLDGGQEDYQYRKQHGVPALRRRRLCRIAEETFDQGGVLTLEDFDLSFIPLGYTSISGTTHSEEETLIADLTLEGGPVETLEFSTSEFQNVDVVKASVTVNGKEMEIELTEADMQAMVEEAQEQ